MAEQTAREKLKEMLVEDVGYHPDEIDRKSDMYLIALTLEFLVTEIEKQRDHTHKIM